MFEFSHQPPDDAAPAGTRLLRTPPTGKIEGVITTDKLIGTYTHYYNRRTMPCDPQFCEACNANNSRRWHAWCGLFLPREGELAILELTAQAAYQTQKYYDAERTLRGARLFAWRPSNTPNGRVVLRLERWARTLDDLPPEPDILQQLYTIWGLKQIRPELETQLEREIAIRTTRTKASKNGAH